MSNNEMIMLPREVVEQALEALLNEGEFRKLLKPFIEKSIDSIRDALKQPHRKPTQHDIADSALLGNIESQFNACMHKEHCKRWKERSGAVVEQKLRSGMVCALPPGDYVGVVLRGRYYTLTTPQPPVAEQPQGELDPLTDWQVPKGVLSAISRAGMTLLKTRHGYELQKLGPVIAHGIGGKE